MMKETLAKEWEKLENKYITKNIENLSFLKKKLFPFHYMQGTTMNRGGARIFDKWGQIFEL